MADLPNITDVIVNSVLDDHYALLLQRPYRSIGYIIPNIVIREIHRDDLVVTDHPVEKGADISDHAFKRPMEVIMICGWSNSTGQSQNYVRTIYNNLLSLQASREPFDVYTGKRFYTSMLISSIILENDDETENALICHVSLREIIITDTAGESSLNVQSFPASSSGVSNLGIQQQKVIENVTPPATVTSPNNIAT